MAAQMEAADRVEWAKDAVRIAEYRVDTLVPGAPLRSHVEAIERPRFMYGRLLPADAADLFRLEGRVPAEVVEELRQRGHNIRVVSDWFTQMGHGHGITLDGGTLRGGADARADGAALGF